MSDTKLFGIWIIVRDHASAKEAVRMSGLPALVMGGNAFVMAAIVAAQAVPNLPLAAAMAAVGVGLIGLAFRIRAGHGAWLPLVFFLFLLFAGATTYVSAAQWMVSPQPVVFGLKLVSSAVIQLFCIAMVGAGMTGWAWLRAKKIPLTF